MNWHETRDFLSPCFPEEIRGELEMLLPGELREIRLRADRPTVFKTATRTVLLDWAPSRHQLETLVEGLSEHSLYARTEETGQGYLTLRGGHRAGLCGTVQHSGNQSVLTGIGSVCIRIAAEWPGCADMMLQHMAGFQSLLLIGLPGSGKTTLLRDLARQLASGKKPLQIGVVDERSELAACRHGVPQLDIGKTSDVLDGLPKAEAIPWLIRSMSPQVIITDELGNPEDASAIMEAVRCGVSICASAHGGTLEDVLHRPALASLADHQIFDRYALLSSEGGGVLSAVYDRTGRPVFPA